MKKTFREIGADHVTTLAASAAYHFFFSLFPLLLFLTPLLSLVGAKREMATWLVGQLARVLPAAQVHALQPVLENVIFSDNAPGLISVGLLLAAWTGSNVFGTLMGALNMAFDVEEHRPWWKQQLIRLGTFAVGGVIMLLSTIVFLNGEGVVNWIGGLLHMSSAALWVWKIAQFPIALAGIVALAFITFYFLPDVRQRKRHALVGAIATTALWILATLLFRVYMQHFPPNPAYGFIGAAIILLTWMYYTMFVVLLGGELASELHHGTGLVAPDRGAIYLGRVVTGQGPGNPSTG